MCLEYDFLVKSRNIIVLIDDVRSIASALKIHTLTSVYQFLEFTPVNFGVFKYRSMLFISYSDCRFMYFPMSLNKISSAAVNGL